LQYSLQWSNAHWQDPAIADKEKSDTLLEPLTPVPQDRLVEPLQKELVFDSESPVFVDAAVLATVAALEEPVQNTEEQSPEEPEPAVTVPQVISRQSIAITEKLVSHRIDLSQPGVQHSINNLFPERPVITKALIKGKVIDGQSKAGFKALIKAGKQGVLTDESGAFQLELEPGKYKVIARMIGYADASQSVKIGVGEVAQLNLMMVATSTHLHTLTNTAGRFERPFSELVTSTEMAYGPEIQEKGFNTLDEVLERIPGVSVVDDQINIRGGAGYTYGSGSRIMLLLDGIPALQGDAAFPDWDFMPVENASQVEVMKGASSALYGSSSLNGVVNVRTKFPDKPSSTRVSTFGTTYLAPKDKSRKWWSNDTLSAPYATGISLMHSRKFEHTDFLASTYLYKENSFRQGEGTEYVRSHLKTRIRFNESAEGGINANVQWGKSKKSFLWLNAEEGAYQTTAGTLTENLSSRVILDPYFRWGDKTGGKHQLLARYYFTNNVSDNGVSDQSNRMQQVFGDYQFQKLFEDHDFVFTAGINGSHTVSLAQLFGDTTNTASNAAVYGEVSKKWFNKLSINAGVRLESNFIANARPEDLKPVPVFLAGLNYELNDRTFLRASWGQGYRYPTIAERFIQTDLDVMRIYPNPELLPERGWSAEFGIKHGFQLGSWNGYADVAGFWMEYQDMVEFMFGRWGTLADPLIGFGFSAQNVGDTQIRGFESGFNGQGRIGPLEAQIGAGYTYVDPTYKNFSPDTVRSSADYNVLKYRYRHTFKTDFQLSYGKIGIGMNARYNSFMEAIDDFFVNRDLLIVAGLEDLGIADFREENPQGDLVVDARVHFRPSPEWTVSLIGRNILNTEYTTRPALLEAPANLTLRVAYNL
ncbi:MAG: TonB-dependent receptor, partial [Bacteroidota bacterium]